MTIAALLAGAICAHAQQGQGMSLKDCMQYAISNSTKVRIQQAATGDARIQRRDAILAAFTPNISGGVSGYYNFGRTIDPNTNTYISTTTFYNSYSLSAGMTLFNGFEAVNNLKIANTSLAMGYSQEEQVEADICLATMEAYYNAVYYSLLAEIYQSQVKTAEESVELARRQEKLGLKGYADVVQMESDLAERMYEMTNAENLRNDALLTLQDVMFWPVDSVLVIDTGIPEGNVLTMGTSGETETIINIAKSSQPSAIIALGTMENARREWNTARWQLLPTLSLYSGWSTTYFNYPGGSSTDPFNSQFSANSGEYVQLSLSIPIFNRLSKHSQIARKKHAFEQASAEYDQKMRDIESEVKRAIQDRDGASAAYVQAQRKADVQEEAYRLNSKKFEQGLISPIEFKTATDSYLSSKADRMNSLFKYYIKKSVVEYYGGTGYIDQ